MELAYQQFNLHVTCHQLSLTLVDLGGHGTQPYHQAKFGRTGICSYQTHGHGPGSGNVHEWVVGRT